MPIDLFDKYLKDQESVCVMNGLLVSQLICSRRMMDAFDAKVSATEIVSMIMSDISTIMERIEHGDIESNTTDDR